MGSSLLHLALSALPYEPFFVSSRLILAIFLAWIARYRGIWGGREGVREVLQDATASPVVMGCARRGSACAAPRSAPTSLPRRERAQDRHRAQRGWRSCTAPHRLDQAGQAGQVAQLTQTYARPAGITISSLLVSTPTHRRFRQVCGVRTPQQGAILAQKHKETLRGPSLMCVWCGLLSCFHSETGEA